MNIDRVPGYEVVNAQVQVNAPGDRFYLRGFVQNLTNDNAITGQGSATSRRGCTPTSSRSNRAVTASPPASGSDAAVGGDATRRP
ncbi:hypothetical protein, partial [Enterococcus faecium]|uniref:hypothetical protein n=1 Tax=Enterococcus faecium TaxID=1352 RepID=UPI003F43ADCC